MRPLRLFALWLSLGWLTIAVVIALSLMPHPIRLPLSFGDKIGHFSSYALLMGWFVQLYHSRLLLWLHALLLVALGVGLEFLQGYTGRHFEYADMAANSCGVLLGLGLLWTPWQELLLRCERRFISYA